MADVQERFLNDGKKLHDTLKRDDKGWEMEDESIEDSCSWQAELYSKLGKYRNEETQRKAIRYVQDCVLQNASFSMNVNAFEAHLEKSADLNLVCRHCGASTTDKSAFMVHLSQRHHLLPRRYLCLRCHLASNSTERLLRHIVRQHIKPVMCEQCNEILFEKSQLSNHKIIHLELCRINPSFLSSNSHALIQIDKNVNGKLTCSLCGTFEVALVETLKLHLSEAHDALPKRYICLHCPFTDNFASAFKAHYEKTHPELKTFGKSGALDNICSKCGKSFSSGAALNAHLRHQHAAVGFSCEICSQSFRTYFQMYRHKLKHRNEKKYASEQNSNQQTKCCIYRCTFGTCDRTFKRASRLRDHLNTHYGTSSYKCHICSKTFTRKDTLDVHLKTVHEGLRPFSCSFCEYRASQGSLLRSHIKAIHKNANAVSEFMNGEINQPLLKKKREYILQYNQQQNACQQNQQNSNENAVNYQRTDWNWSQNNTEWDDFIDVFISNQSAQQSFPDLNNTLHVYNPSYVSPCMNHDAYCSFTDTPSQAYYNVETDVGTKNLPVKERLKMLLKDNNVCQTFMKASTEDLNTTDDYCEFERLLIDRPKACSDSLCQCVIPLSEPRNQFQTDYRCVWNNEAYKDRDELNSNKNDIQENSNEFLNGFFSNSDGLLDHASNNKYVINSFGNYAIPECTNSPKYSFRCNPALSVVDNLKITDPTSFDWGL